MTNGKQFCHRAVAKRRRMAGAVMNIQSLLLQAWKSKWFSKSSFLAKQWLNHDFTR